MNGYIDIVFDGPPSAEPGRFVEVENASGASMNAGEWIDRGDGYWALRIRREVPTSTGKHMSGPEHYQEAERLLDEAADKYSCPDVSHYCLAAAQVHATLALAAATAYPAIRDYMGDEASEPRKWTQAAS